jgi:hypothetical protein
MEARPRWGCGSGWRGVNARKQARHAAMVAERAQVRRLFWLMTGQLR